HPASHCASDTVERTHPISCEVRDARLEHYTQISRETYSLVNWCVSTRTGLQRPLLQSRRVTITVHLSTPTSPTPAPPSRAITSTKRVDNSAESSLASIRSTQTLSSRSQTLPGLPRSATLRRVASRWKRA